VDAPALVAHRHRFPVSSLTSQGSSTNNNGVKLNLRLVKDSTSGQSLRYERVPKEEEEQEEDYDELDYEEEQKEERATFCSSQIYIIYSGFVGEENNALDTEARTPSRETLANQRHLPILFSNF
jgi:hypothetical protein